MTVESFIARRYLRPRFNLVTIISFISIAGITIGVAALIIVLSVFNGFNGVVKSLLIGFDPHIRITPVATRTVEPAELLTKLASHSEIVAAAPFVSGRSAVMHGDGLQVVQVRGMRETDTRTAIGLADRMVRGRFREGDADVAHPIVLGFLLNNTLGTGIGDTISLLSQSGLEEAFTQLAQPKLVRCVVTGIFESSNKEYDAFTAYADIPTSRELFDIKGGVMGVELRLTDPEASSEVAASLRKELGSGYRIETWTDLHSDLFAVMELERWAAYIILSLIIVVAVFNVLGSLTMTVIEKQRDIGILKAMGSTDRSIRRTFMYEGLMIGVSGTILGTLIGVGVCWLQMNYGFYKLPAGNFIIPALPVAMRGVDIALVALTALLLAYTSAMYPARRASRLQPADAVRWE
jgi:lipoprotein-releasing system permease protein